MNDLGINDSSINYEVALEVLGQELQPFIQAIEDEKKKPNPSSTLIQYYEGRISAIDDLQENLRPTDTEIIDRILDKSNPVFRGH
jgi:hypothetical protein